MEFKIDMKFAALAMAAIFLVLLGQIVPIIGASLEGSTTIPGDVSATGTFTYTGIGVVGETINISTETYTVVSISDTGAPSAFEFGFNITTNDATNLTSNLTAAINTDSTLVTAVDGGSDDTTVTSIIAGTAGNAYASTENQTNGAWEAVLMSGGEAGSEWNRDVNSDMPDVPTKWASIFNILATAITLGAIFYAVSPVIGKTFK
jgi:hypothetical protein